MHFSIFHWFEIKLLDTTVSQLLSHSSAFLSTSTSLQSSCPHSLTILSSIDPASFPMSPHDLLVKSQWSPDFQIQGHFSFLILLDLSTAFGIHSLSSLSRYHSSPSPSTSPASPHLRWHIPVHGGDSKMASLKRGWDTYQIPLRGRSSV